MKQLVAIGILYLIGVFIANTWNPLDWWIIGKVIFAFLILISAGSHD